MLMDHTTIADLLSSYVDRLVMGDEHTQDYFALFPELRSELEPLLHLARDLATWLRPIKPRPAFRHDLRRALVSSGYRQLSPSLGLESLERDARRDWMLSAAAIGSAVSVVGVLAYLWRNRSMSQGPTLPVQ